MMMDWCDECGWRWSWQVHVMGDVDGRGYDGQFDVMEDVDGGDTMTDSCDRKCRWR